MGREQDLKQELRKMREHMTLPEVNDAVGRFVTGFRDSVDGVQPLRDQSQHYVAGRDAGYAAMTNARALYQRVLMDRIQKPAKEA